MPFRIISHALQSSLAPDAAQARIADLLTAEGVRYASTRRGLQSTQTPFGLLSVDRVSYTRRNWVGLNPFAFVSSLEITLAPAERSATRVTLRVDRTRALIVASLYMAGYLLTPFVPWQVAVGVVAVCTGLIWFMASYVAGHLLKSEIERAVNPRAA